jgi:peroxiredoxin Q/BCP
MLKEGSAAPAFTTKDAEGRRVQLKDFRGQKVVLYFYPKDDTPGCTKEACSFRDAFEKKKKRGINVLGVSINNEASHKKFAQKYTLPFTLLTDTDHSISDAYESYGEKSSWVGPTWVLNATLSD